MVTIHYLKPNDKIQPYVAGVCEGLENFSVNDISVLVNNNNPPDYVSFDGKGIDLEDYSKKFYESGDYAGFVSSNVSDSDMVVASELYISLSGSVGEFSLDGGISFHFYGDCCREMYVQYRNRDTEVFYEEILEVNSEVFILKTDGFGDYCVGLTVMFTKTALPNQFIKLSYVKFGTVTVFAKLKNINLLEEINVLSDDLPMNQLEYNVATNTEIDFKENDLMYLYSNGKYYGTFYLDDAERISKNVYSVKACNSINILENTEYKEWDMDMNLEKLSNQIKTISGIDIKVPTESYGYFGNIEPSSCRYVLCMCGFASGLMVDSSRSDGIRLIPIPTTVTSVIRTSDKRILGDCTYQKSTPISKALLQQAETFGGENYSGTTLKTVNLINAKNKRTLYYFEKPLCVDVEESEAGGKITIYSTASNYIDFEATEKNTTIKAYGLGYIYENYILENHLASDAKSNEKDFTKLNLRGDRTTGGSTTQLLEFKKKDIKKYIQSGGKIKAKIRLRGERVGDLIQIETAYDGMKTGIITYMNISFGYEDVADIEVLEWNL